MSTVEERLAVLEHRISVLEARPQTASSGATASGSTGRGLVATAHDLDGEYGDPIVKKDPRRWEGASYAGCRMSECPPDYLDEIASLFDWMGDQDDAQGKTWVSKTKPGATPRPASSFKRKDAALARGWAARKRNGHSAPRPTSPKHDPDGVVDEFASSGGSDFGADDGIPFALPFDIAPRHLRQRVRWERW